MRDPQDCRDMTELRAEIDRLDEALVTLFAERATYIDRAAALKAGNGLPARITPRVEQVVENVRRHAEAKGMDADLAERLWRELMEWAIDHEEDLLAAGQKTESRP